MFDACICSEGDGPVEMLQQTRPRARKAHRCSECREEILPGETYLRSKFFFDGKWEEHKICVICERIRDSLFTCWAFGMMWEDIHDAYCGYWDDGECVCPR